MHVVQGIGSPIEVYKRMQEDTKTETEYAGSDWLRPLLENQGRTLSPFGAQVADLLGELHYGIYHAQREVLGKKVDWGSDRWIQVVFRGSMGTYDGDTLTRLVFLCHERAIRCEVEAVANGYLQLCFSPRQREGRMYQRHPNIDQAIAAFIRGQQ